MSFDFSKKPGRTSYNRDLVKDETPLISIITPYYNAKNYFKELYPCVLNQTFPWFEWIIVDDGSTHSEEAAFLDDIEASDPRIKVIHKPNGGISSARNAGIRNSSTDIIVTLDADELIEPTYFELLYWAIYYNPDSAWAYTDSLGFQSQEYVWQHPFDAEKLKSYNFLVESAAIRKKDLLDVGCYDEIEKNYFEDWRLWLKMLSKSKKPVHINSLEFWYRRTETGVLNTITTDVNVKKRADDLIHEVAVTADGSVVAKTFNGVIPRDYFVLPKKSNFSKEYYSKKTKQEILFFISSMAAGGVSRFNLNFVKSLNKDLYNITVIATENSDDSWKQKFREYVSDIYTLSDFLDVKNYAEFISYIIQTRSIDMCFISNSYYGYYLLPWLKAQYPYVPVVDYVHMVEPYWREGGFARASMAMSDFLDKTFVSSEATKQELITHFSRNSDDLETCYAGVDCEQFDPAKIPYGTVRTQYHIPESGKIVLFPCTLHSRKRPYLMLEIAKEVISKDSSIYFLIVGDGFERDELLKKIKLYNLSKNIIWVGFQDDIRPFYRDADLTLICSLVEGISLSAYESCAMMTPVITSDVGGQRELINENIGIVLPAFQREKDIDVQQYSNDEIMQYVTSIFKLLDVSNKKKLYHMCTMGRTTIKNYFQSSSIANLIEYILNNQFSQDSNRGSWIPKSNKKLPALVLDTISMYIAFEGMTQENSRIWKERCYYQQELSTTQTSLNELKYTLEGEKSKFSSMESSLALERENSLNLKISLDEVTKNGKKLSAELSCIQEEFNLLQKSSKETEAKMYSYEHELFISNQKLATSEEQKNYYQELYDHIQLSFSFRLGRIITYLPRVILKTIHSVRDKH